MTQPQTIPEKSQYTYQDYAQLPEGSAYQLINGKLIMAPTPSLYHQQISKRLGFLIYEHAEVKNQLGEVNYSPIDVYFEETETYQPDLIFISNERKHIMKEDKVEGAPDIVFEILSVSTAYYDLRHKKQIYAKHGVKEYWIIDPMEQSIEIYELKDGRFELSNYKKQQGQVKSSVLTSLTIELRQIF